MDPCERIVTVTPVRVLWTDDGGYPRTVAGGSTEKPSASSSAVAPPIRGRQGLAIVFGGFRWLSLNLDELGLVPAVQQRFVDALRAGGWLSRRGHRAIPL